MTLTPMPKGTLHGSDTAVIFVSHFGGGLLPCYSVGYFCGELQAESAQEMAPPLTDTIQV